VILAGGPGGSNRMMQPIADHLRDRFRCVLLEQRGTDRSQLFEYRKNTLNFDAYVSDLEGLRQHLGQEQMILVGNSWGMTLALAYACAYPGHVRAVAALGSGGLTVEHLKVFRDNRRVRITADQEQRISELHGRSLAPEELVTEIARIITPSYFFHRKVGAKAGDALEVGDINHRLAEYTEAILSDIDQRVYHSLSRIEAPVLIIQGRQDLAPEEVAFTIRDKVRDSRIVLLNECGHVPWLDQPEATWNALDAFLTPYAVP
jgi:proline iminopeptidase